jgi:hypothetical protein
MVPRLCASSATPGKFGTTSHVLPGNIASEQAEWADLTAISRTVHISAG